MTNWKIGMTGTWQEFHDMALVDPVPLVGCDGTPLSPKDRMSFTDCSYNCSKTPGCFAFLYGGSNFCVFVANDDESPMKKSSGNNVFFWGGAVENIDSSKLPSNCFSNATVPHN
jgi:hypothetical protein